MEGYGRSTYGDRFADVYDRWYGELRQPGAMVDLVIALAGPGGRVLELGVGTGRLAIPLAAHGLAVTGVDASAAMLDRLGQQDHDGAVAVVEGDMVDDLPPGPFECIFVAYNTLFNLESAERQAACFAAVAARLAPGGRFVVDAFVPDEPARSGTQVAVRSMTVDEVVLSVSEHDPVVQRATGHLVQLVDGAPVRLRPWSIRYATPAELDEMASSAGLQLVDRWADESGAPFAEDSDRHVSVYRAPA